MTKEIEMKELGNKFEYPDGYYLLSNPCELEKSVVYLYTPDAFADGRDEEQTTRHLAFNPTDGGAVIPVWDVKSDTKLEPLSFCKSTRPTTNEELKHL